MTTPEALTAEKVASELTANAFIRNNTFFVNMANFVLAQQATIDKLRKELAEAVRDIRERTEETTALLAENEALTEEIICLRRDLGNARRTADDD